VVGGDIGRPAMQITARRAEPLERVSAMPQPAGWVTHYSTSDYEYRVNLAARTCVGTQPLAEATPAVSPDLAPNCLALYLGRQGVEMPGTVWCKPCIDSPATASFDYDEDNPNWRFKMRLGRECVRLGEGKFLVSFPDLIEGLDTLAATRGTERLLADLVERPDWVHASLRQITDRYFRYYDALYDLIRDAVGGSVFWAWAPGRVTKRQCDFSAMISPEMFAEFMVPVLREMTERVAYSMCHWDGPGALAHHDHLLAIPHLTMLQWTPGAGVEPTDHLRWWPYYHKTVDAGKRVLISCGSLENLRALKREFGPRVKALLINVHASSGAEAEEYVRVAHV
jgi:5-methyltetrahydrofolate--homocysteine methyltransferase